MLAFGTDYPICHRYLCFCYHFAINEMLSLSQHHFISKDIILFYCPKIKWFVKIAGKDFTPYRSHYIINF